MTELPIVSRFRGKAWLLLAIPLGFTTWAAFLYIGIRARRPQWLAWAAVYAATLGVYRWHGASSTDILNGTTAAPPVPRRISASARLAQARESSGAAAR